MTRQDLNTSIDAVFNDNIPDQSLMPSAEGTQLKLIADYIDQQISAIPISVKTSGTVTLTVTPLLLPYNINSCSFSGGYGYLPDTTEIGKEIIVMSNANITINANVGVTAKMFLTFGTFITGISMALHDMYRFTYIGFGSGTGGTIGGYWKAEKI